ncbi:MAG: hypothetical protein P8181_07935, partial [bacterium]
MLDRTACSPFKIGTILAYILVFMFVCGSEARAGSPDPQNFQMSGGVAGGPASVRPGPRQFLSVVGVVHGFTGDEMKDAYGQMFGACVRGGQRFESGAGWRVEGGLMIGVGDPLFPDSTWHVDADSSSMEMMVVPLGASFLYEFARDGSERAVTPYLGVGLDGYFGFERTSVKISRFPEGRLDWNDTKYRYTWAGHALAGATIRLTEKVRGLVEIRWTLGIDGSDVDQSFSEEEINEGWLEVDKAVQRPDFNFTGWSVS